ncbi:hypothetical protein BGX38DRAFT_1284170 [Terfezia claveryi]|nr:hypothetical protein BGX38DRAFT_1314290 [Terfezia claveryi]KAF8436692.1 hypothetical protein BGX38DRAFT_1284170 [Terfezia claveryi]
MDFEYMGSGKDGDEGPPQSGSISPRNASHPMEGIMTGRKRAEPERRKERERYSCALLGGNCPFMPESGFRDCAKVKEDALRHINSYQCERCGKRFGKKYRLDRHRLLKRKRLCIAGEFAEVSPELKALLIQLEKASGYQEIKAIMDQCRSHYNGYQDPKHQGQAGEESEKETCLQRQSMQDLNNVEASGLTSVASQSPGVTMGTSELIFPQQGVEVSASYARGLGSSGVHHEDYPDARDSYYINNQAVQGDWAAGLSIPTQVSNPNSPIHQRAWPVNFQGAPTYNTETATSAANYPQGYNLGQQDIGHDRGIDTNSPASDRDIDTNSPASDRDIDTNSPASDRDIALPVTVI